MKAHLMSVRFRDCLMAGFVAVAVLLGGAVASDAKEPLKVFILTGQSNRQGHSHVRTMDVMALDPVTAPLLKDLRQEDGTPKVSERVWISSLGSSQEEKVGRPSALVLPTHFLLLSSMRFTRHWQVQHSS